MRRGPRLVAFALRTIVSPARRRRSRRRAARSRAVPRSSMPTRSRFAANASGYGVSTRPSRRSSAGGTGGRGAAAKPPQLPWPIGSASEPRTARAAATAVGVEGWACVASAGPTSRHGLSRTAGRWRSAATRSTMLPTRIGHAACVPGSGTAISCRRGSGARLAKRRNSSEMLGSVLAAFYHA